MAETPSFEFERFVKTEMASMRHPLRILEIGGGPQTFVQHPDAHYTVLEISSDALETSTYAHQHLLGDAQTFDLPEAVFDIVVFWNVLEHVARPTDALHRSARALQSGGLMIIRGPELRSMKSLVTRLTPHFIHVLFYRYVLGFANAGKPGHAPFKIEHNADAEADRLIPFVNSLGFMTTFDQRYVGDQEMLFRSYSPIGYRTYLGISKVIRLLTGGRQGGRESDFVLAFRKTNQMGDIYLQASAQKTKDA